MVEQTSQRKKGGVLKNLEALRERISEVLQERSQEGHGFPDDILFSPTVSSVLVLLSGHCDGLSEGPCVIFNKRSDKVRQPGDLCFPGGRVAPRVDLFLSKVLKCSVSPLARWQFWPHWRDKRREQANRLSLLFATSLRESAEEMRLNPFGVTFLGPMPPEDLLMFRRILYPMVAWINRQKHFLPNWEVEKIVPIPLRELLNPDSYACYRLHFKGRGTTGDTGYTQDFPCVCHQNGREREVLWGASYRIATSFLKMVFGFTAPSIDSLPVIYKTLDERYLNGST